MNRAEVLIVGAGPVGLSLALGLARLGVRTLVVEKDRSISEHSKAPGIHGRTLEIFGQWGIADAVVRQGHFLPNLTAHDATTGRPALTIPLDELSDICRYAGLCILQQAATEHLLLDAVRKSGLCEVRFGHELLQVEEAGDGVTGQIRSADGPYSEEARYLVGCDGADSTVRKLLGLPFDGETYPIDAILADVRVRGDRAEQPFPRLTDDGERIMVAIRLESGDWRLISIVPADPERVDPHRDVDPDLIRKIAASTLGTADFECYWASRFRLHRRSTSRFRVGKIMLAGDAAHLNSPIGGQGMNSGIHDAHNLAWKLAAILNGGDEQKLLESYHTERHGLVRSEVNRVTDRLTRAALAPAYLRPIGRRLAPALLAVRPIRRWMMKRVAMLAGRYRSSPLLAGDSGNVGTRVPDVELAGASGSVRLHELIGTGAAVLFLDHSPMAVDPELNLRLISVGSGEWSDPNRVLRRHYKDKVLVVRPDHIVGWAGRPAREEDLDSAIRTALGSLPARAASSPGERS